MVAVGYPFNTDSEGHLTVTDEQQIRNKRTSILVNSYPIFPFNLFHFFWG